MSTITVKGEMDGWVGRNELQIQKKSRGHSLMNIVQHSILLQMLARAVLAVGYILVIGFFAVLAFAWVLCGQLYQLSERLLGKKHRAVR